MVAAIWLVLLFIELFVSIGDNPAYISPCCFMHPYNCKLLVYFTLTRGLGAAGCTGENSMLVSPWL